MLVALTLAAVVLNVLCQPGPVPGLKRLKRSIVAGSDDRRQQYLQTVAKYSNGLSMNEEDTQEHYDSFVTFAEMVDDINADSSKHYVSECNQFSYQTQSELQSHLGLNASDVKRAKLMARNVFVANKRDVEEIEKRDLDVDYTNKLPGIKNQGGCGSCWTFGATAALEYQVNKDRTGTMKSLSEQQYLDCVYEGSRDGCNGGWPDQCYTWTANHGSHIASTSNYPYVASDGACNWEDYSNAISGWTVQTGATYIDGDSNMLVAVDNDRLGVMSVAITVVNSFYSYSSGVYSDSGCGGSINHAVDVVGYGTDGSDAYWRVRNSWGSWGDGGYINMERGTGGANVNMCNIASYAHYPEVTGADDGNSDDDDSDGNDGDDGDDDSSDEWCEHADKYLAGYAGGSRVGLADLGQAKSACGSRSDCGGVTMEPDTAEPYTLRSGSTLMDSSGGEVSYLAGACEDDGDDGNSDCEDGYSSCSSWANDYNYCCVTYQDWMAENCPVSCGTCDGGAADCSDDEDEETEEPACEDSYSSCSSWANDYNYCCETYEEWMAENCPVSCDTCSGGLAECESSTEESTADYTSCDEVSVENGQVTLPNNGSWPVSHNGEAYVTCDAGFGFDTDEDYQTIWCDNGDFGELPVCSSVCTWKTFEDKKYKGPLTGWVYDLESAQAACPVTEGCAGVSCKRKKCRLVSKAKGKADDRFTGYKMLC